MLPPPPTDDKGLKQTNKKEFYSSLDIFCYIFNFLNQSQFRFVIVCARVSFNAEWFFFAGGKFHKIKYMVNISRVSFGHFIFI